LLIRIDPTSTVPLGDQVAASVRRAVADGAVAAGDKLPPARELAESLGVNLHTVLRGYQRLRDEGLVDLRRGRGAVLTDRATAGHAALAEQVEHVVALARRAGLAEQDVVDLVRAAFQPD
jgi:Predicted transcriptional regulators